MRPQREHPDPGTGSRTGQNVEDTVAGRAAARPDARSLRAATSTLTAPPTTAPRLAPAAAGPRRARGGRRPDLARLRALDPHRLGLAVVLLTALGLRLWGVRQGLPYSYNSDEAAHFVPRAVAYFDHDLNPQYFLNPPFYGYIVHFALELWFGSGDAVQRRFATDPTPVFVLARVVAALLGTVAVWLTYLAGARLFDRTVALVGAAVLAVAFLPNFYSHLALNDVPTLAFVALALYGTAGILQTGARREYALAAIGVGVGAATKYTAAYMLVPLLIAAGFDAARHGVARVTRCAVGALALVGVAFLVANPYALLDYHRFHHDVAKQRSLAGGSEPIKLGTTSSSGTAFYLWVYTWGLGWVPSLAAIGGAVRLIARRAWSLAGVLIPAPIAFILYMGDQQRFFGRWLMPTFPLVALLGAYGTVACVRWLERERRVPSVLAVGVAAVVLLGQGLATTIHDDRVLSRPDTRNTARAWMVAHVPPGAKIVVEPVVSSAWATDTDPPLATTSPTPTGARWQLWNTASSNIAADGRPLPDGEHRFVPLDEYERTLYPGLITRYEQGGYCWVVVSSLQAGRSFAQPRIVPAALQYYAALARQSQLVYHLSPFGRVRSSRRSVPFSFDWSIDYYPSQYHDPGPEMSVYRLTGGRCAGTG